MKVSYRPPTTNDTAFIMATWLKGQRHQGDRAFMTSTTYFENEQKRIRSILVKSNLTIVCDVEDSNHVFGYCAYNILADLFIIHYAHLKKPYRSLGIMTTLLRALYPKFEKDEVGITHINPIVSGLRPKFKLKFNPYLGGYL